MHSSCIRRSTYTRASMQNTCCKLLHSIYFTYSGDGSVMHFMHENATWIIVGRRKSQSMKNSLKAHLACASQSFLVDVIKWHRIPGITPSLSSCVPAKWALILFSRAQRENVCFDDKIIGTLRWRGSGVRWERGGVGGEGGEVGKWRR